MNTNEMSPAEDKKDYSFLFQKPEEYQVKVDEEGNYLTDLDSFEIPETAFDSGEDITSTFMGNDSVEFPYIIGSAMEDNEEIPFEMPQYPTEVKVQYGQSDVNTPSYTDTYIPDAEHVLDFEPSYRDYLDTEIEEYNSDFGDETDFGSKPNNEVMENPSFDYNDYYDVENEDTFEYGDKMKSSEYEEEEEDDEDFEYEEEEEYDFEDEEESDEEEEDEDDEEESEEYEEDEEEEEEDESDEEESKMRKENFKKFKENNSVQLKITNKSNTPFIFENKEIMPNEFILTSKDKLSVGRENNNDIVIPNKMVSGKHLIIALKNKNDEDQNPKHARIFNIKDMFTVVDLNSTGGTLINRRDINNNQAYTVKTEFELGFNSGCKLVVEIISKDKEMNKEVKEAISYLETYSSVTNKNLSLQEKVRCLSEAGYNKTIIKYIVSNTKSKHKSIKEINKTPKLNKFIEKNNSKLLEKLYKEHKFSLKEQKLFEGLTELNKHILKQTPIFLNLMTTRNPTFEGLSNQPEKQEALKERFTTISNLIGMIPSLYTIAIASFVENEEQNKKENYSIRNKKNKFREQDPQGQTQDQNQDQGQQTQTSDEQPSSQDQAKINKINTAWIETLTAITQLSMIIQKNTVKVTQQVGTLGKIKALATKVGSKLGNLFRGAIAKAKELKKSWDELGTTEGEGIGIDGKPVNTSKI